MDYQRLLQRGALHVSIASDAVHAPNSRRDYRCCWLLSVSLWQRAHILLRLASCRAEDDGDDSSCRALADDDENQLQRVLTLLGAMQWSDTASCFSTSIAYLIVVSVFLFTTTALRIAVARSSHSSPTSVRQPLHRKALLKSPPPLSLLPSSAAHLLSRLSMQVPRRLPRVALVSRATSLR